MSEFNLLQKIKMGLGGLFLGLIPNALITSVLFFYFVSPVIWVFTLIISGISFYAGVLLLGDSKFPKQFFLYLTAISLLMIVVAWYV